MSQNQTASKPAAARLPQKPVAVKEKEKPIGYVNWAVIGEDGAVLRRSSRGFSLFDNKYLTQAERDLLEVAKANDGSVTLKAELRVATVKEDVEHHDLTGAIVAKK